MLSDRRSVADTASDPVGETTLRGFIRPVGAFDIKGLDAARVAS
jgi:hypothetical protein